jgi:hypothetical protein
MLRGLNLFTRANPHARVIFLGRDGYSVGHVIAELDPALYGQYGVMAHVPRTVADAALYQAEQQFFADAGHGIGAFRKDGPHRALDVDVGGWWTGLIGLMDDQNAYLDGERPAFALVDSGYKGSIQEMLSAAYPRAQFYGCYVFCSVSPQDPHPHDKQGYAFHLDASSGYGGLGMRDRVVDDVELTFAHHDAVAAVEELLRGTGADPLITTEGSLVQCASMAPFAGLNPLRVAHEYRDPLLREATLAVMLRSTSQYAREVAWNRATDPQTWYASLSVDAARLRPQLHAWLTGRDGDPALRRLLDSFVRRADKDLVDQLAGLIHDMSLPRAEQNAVWAGFDRCEDLAAKDTFVRQMTADLSPDIDREAFDAAKVAAYGFPAAPATRQAASRPERTANPQNPRLR